MKKAILIVILTSALAVTLCISTIYPVQANISYSDWMGQTHSYDPYLNARGYYPYWPTVFPEGTNATLMVIVYNNYWGADSLNVSAVKVLMDWNTNYSSTECSETGPVVMPYNTYRTFTIEFEVPSISVASNLFMHRYTIYVEEVNATGAVFPHHSINGYDFVVYSTIQKEDMNLYDDMKNLFSNYGYNPSFSDTNAYSLWKNGTEHYYLGLYKHETGQFDSAKTHYELALGLLNEAIATEAAYDLDRQEYDDNYDRQMDALYMMQEQAYLKQIETYANATMKEADASMRIADAQFALAEATMMQAYAWIVFGIGFVVFGFAAVIWASKRPSSP